MAKQRVAKKDTTRTGFVSFAFSNGKKLLCDLSLLSKEVYDIAATKGVGHRVGDSYADASNQPNPVEWAYLTACETWRLLSVDAMWEKEAEFNGGVLAEALSRVRKISLDAAKAQLEKLSEEKTKKVRDLLKVTIAEIAVERAKARAEAEATREESLDALFDE